MPNGPRTRQQPGGKIGEGFPGGGVGQAGQQFGQGNGDEAALPEGVIEDDPIEQDDINIQCPGALRSAVRTRPNRASSGRMTCSLSSAAPQVFLKVEHRG